MAERGKPIDDYTRKRIIRVGKYTPKLRLAKELGVSRNTVKKYLKMAFGSLTTT